MGRSWRIASTSGTQKPSCSEQTRYAEARASSSCLAASSTEPRNGSWMRSADASRRQALPYASKPSSPPTIARREPGAQVRS